MSDAPKWIKVSADKGWTVVTRLKRATPVFRVAIETEMDRASDQCTDGHPECAESPENLCVYKLRSRIPCALAARSKAGCCFGDACEFDHNPGQGPP